MKFLGKLLIVILMFFGQIGFLCIAQGDSVPIPLLLLVTFMIGFWCENYFLGFINGVLSWSSFFMAVGLWSYAVQGVSLWNVLLPALIAPEFYGFALVFGILGILSVKLKFWMKKREANQKREL